MKRFLTAVVGTLCLVGMIAGIGYLIWHDEIVPRRDFTKYFNMTRPKDSVAREAAIPKVIDRLFQLHSELPEKEVTDLNRQINETESRVSESRDERDRYFRLLGQRDQLIKQSQPMYDQYATACNAAAVTLDAYEVSSYPGNLLIKAGCPAYPGKPF